jgi:hypothetical protein
MSFGDRIKVFILRLMVPFLSAGMFQVTVVYECLDCGRYLYDDDECPCIFTLPKEDDIN